MRESTIEKRLNVMVKNMDGESLKWTSSRRGVPDRLVFLPIPKEHRAIVNRYLKIIETKATDGVASEQQEYVHGLLLDLGFKVYVPRSVQQVERILLDAV